MSAVLRLPEVLTGMDEAQLTAWHVKVGDRVEPGQPVADLETEKATVEYAADAGGVVADLLVAEADAVKVGTPIMLLATGGESLDEARRTVGGAPTAATRPATGPSPAASAPAVAGTSSDGPPLPLPARLRATPLVRRLAAERGIDLTALTGTGPGGRIVRRDLDRFTASDEKPVATPRTEDRPAISDAVTSVPHSPMRRAIARRLGASKASVPHFYLSADCRVDTLMELRRQLNEELELRLSVNDFVVKAVGGALRDVPEMNAVWTDEAVLRHEEVDVAVAVALDDGLVTPVVRNVAGRSVGDVSAAIRELAQRGRTRTLRQAELEGGTFTVSNLGMYGTRQFTAIINPPHSGILAVGAVSRQPVVEAGAIVPGHIMTVTLSADHRVVDGATGARWLQAFVRRVQNPLATLAH